MLGCWARSALDVPTRGLTTICTRSLCINREFRANLAENTTLLGSLLPVFIFLVSNT